MYCIIHCIITCVTCGLIIFLITATTTMSTIIRQCANDASCIPASTTSIIECEGVVITIPDSPNNFGHSIVPKHDTYDSKHDTNDPKHDTTNPSPSTDDYKARNEVISRQRKEADNFWAQTMLKFGIFATCYHTEFFLLMFTNQCLILPFESNSGYMLLLLFCIIFFITILNVMAARLLQAMKICNMNYDEFEIFMVQIGIIFLTILASTMMVVCIANESQAQRELSGTCTGNVFTSMYPNYASLGLSGMLYGVLLILCALAFGSACTVLVVTLLSVVNLYGVYTVLHIFTYGYDVVFMTPEFIGIAITIYVIALCVMCMISCKSACSLEHVGAGYNY